MFWHLLYEQYCIHSFSEGDHAYGTKIQSRNLQRNQPTRRGRTNHHRTTPSRRSNDQARRMRRLCHSDLSATNGTIPFPPPVVLGHEGACRIIAVGEGVTDYKIGDHVVSSFVSMCGKCRYCQTGRPPVVRPGRKGNDPRYRTVRCAHATSPANRCTDFPAAA
jgi:hypothetical protein